MQPTGAAESHTEPSGGVAQSVAVMVLSAAVIVGVMVAFYYYPFPNGHRPTVGEFVMFFLRELLALLGIIVAIVVVAVRRISRAWKGNDEKDGHAL